MEGEICEDQIVSKWQEMKDLPKTKKYVWVCVRERERERERTCVCVRERKSRGNKT